MIENSAVADSQGNGFIERGVRSVEEIVRTLKLDLEDRLGSRISVDHTIFPWPVEHSVDMLNKQLVGSDGKTAYQRLKERQYREPRTSPHARLCFELLERYKEALCGRDGWKDCG